MGVYVPSAMHNNSETRGHAHVVAAAAGDAAAAHHHHHQFLVLPELWVTDRKSIIWTISEIVVAKAFGFEIFCYRD